MAGQPRTRTWNWIVPTDGTQPCAQDPELWTSQHAVHQRAAADRCKEECPFLRECLLEALRNHPHAHDVWGGQTEMERNRMPFEDREYLARTLQSEIELDNYFRRRAQRSAS